MKALEGAEAAGGEFRARMENGEYGKIYDEATAEFKAKAGRDDFIRFMERTRMKMGTCDMAATVSGKYVSVGEHGQFATISSRRLCENGELQESFTWLASRGKLLLNGYQANSPLLLSD